MYLSIIFTKIYFLFSFFLEFFPFYGDIDNVAGNSTTESSKDLTGGAKELLDKTVSVQAEDHSAVEKRRDKAKPAKTHV